MELCGFFLFFFYRDLKNVPAAVIIWFRLRLLPKNKKVLGKTKKVLDKRNSKCYYNQADADEAGARCTLKIEQCKKKAYAK